MAYYLNLFSPLTYEAFTNSSRKVTGFRERQLPAAFKVQPGDILICYLTKFSRWIGLLKIKSTVYVDDSDLSYSQDDFVVRFKVKPVVWLEKDKTIPIYENDIWNNLSFTKYYKKGFPAWTAMIRSSVKQLPDEDGRFLEKAIYDQTKKEIKHNIDKQLYNKYLK